MKANLQIFLDRSCFVNNLHISRWLWSWLLIDKKSCNHGIPRSLIESGIMKRAFIWSHLFYWSSGSLFLIRRRPRWQHRTVSPTAPHWILLSQQSSVADLLCCRSASEYGLGSYWYISNKNICSMTFSRSTILISNLKYMHGVNDIPNGPPLII